MFQASNKSRSTFGVKHVITRAQPLDHKCCLLRIGHLTIKGSWGRTGRTTRKFEGDGATPIASMRICHGFHKNIKKQNLKTSIPLRRITANMGWCDDPTNANYNRQVRKPFGPSHEDLQRQDELYNYVIVLDWNITQRQRFRGSAIFFHIAKRGYPPTQGCIAICQRDMERVLPYLTTKTRISVI